MNVAVVGAGIAGLSTAWQLAERGHPVTLFEQFAWGHTHGSSHGASRIVRKAYPDPFYTRCMAEGYPLWAELAARSGHDLVHEVGLLYFGAESSPDIVSVAEGLRDLAVPHEVFGPADVRRVFPNLHLDEGEVGIWTPEAGWVEADTTLRVLHDLATSAGVAFRFETPVTLATLEPYDVYVVTAGAWVRAWVPDVPVRITCQTFAFVEGQQRGPVWIEDSPDLCYGFPSTAPGFKIGVHRPGPEADPAQAERPEDPDALRAICESAHRRFGVENPTLTDITRCLYTVGPNDDFVMGRVGDRGYFASPCSGHGFKFGPWLGRLLANFAEGKDAPENWPRFFWQASA